MLFYRNHTAMFHQPFAHPGSAAPAFRPTRPWPRSLRALRLALSAAAVAALLAACGSVPVSSLWKLRALSLETLDPAALRAAVVHSPNLQLHGQELLLSVSVSRKLRLPNGSTTVEQLEEKLPLQELRSTAERSPLAGYDTPQTQAQVWRIDPAALPRLQALRARALGWKGTDDGRRELGLGLELAGCHHSGGSRNQTVTTLIRFTEPGEYIPILRNIDLAETMPAAELKKRFPDCATGS